MRWVDGVEKRRQNLTVALGLLKEGEVGTVLEDRPLRSRDALLQALLLCGSAMRNTYRRANAMPAIS